MRRTVLLLLVFLGILTAGPVSSLHAQAYKVTNLFSDGSVTATTTDPNFQNPWGISVSPTWWINTANTGFSYVISPATSTSPFKVVIPPATSAFPSGSPAGVVTTTGASGMVLSNGTKAAFLFATLDGAIYGWNNALGQNGAVTLVAVNNASAGACYPGLALLNANATTSYLIAPNFGTANTIEVYDQNFKSTKLSGSFTDPTLPSNYGPWSVHILNNQIWVAYALRSTTSRCQQVPGAGSGIVDVFDLNGNFVAHAVTGGNLNAPWGVAFAPSAGFGIFSGDLLIGNFGDGKINVYDPKTYAYLGQLMDSTGKSLVYASLWDLLTGGTPILNSTTVSGGSNTAVYFTAGLANEAHGLFASIASATTAGATPTFSFSAATGAMTVTNGSSSAAMLSVAPVNGFSGSVTFYCTGLPSGATCSFTPTSVNVASNAVSTTQVTINTSGAMQTGSRGEAPLHLHPAIVLTLASLLPFSLFLLRRRLSFHERISLLVPLVVLSLGSAVFILGCGSNSTPPPVPTPTGLSQVSVVAMSSTTGIQQSTNIALTVKSEALASI